MEGDSFWKLYSLLKPHLQCTKDTERSQIKKHKDGAKNGLIHMSMRLSIALQYSAGGSTYNDISIVHGVLHSKVFLSVWRVINAVNWSPSLAFYFPTCHKKQQKIALGFKVKSRPGFGCCASTIDGMLLSIEQPSEEECEQAKCGSVQFFVEESTSLDSIYKSFVNLKGTSLMYV